jgi:aryl-alcohol dehydrogenase-like predicted oxidoreductase
MAMATIPLRAYGNTGLQVSLLGFGAGQIGDGRLEEGHVGRLLNEVLDLGITLIDTARGYGLSEERIGRHIAHRCGEYVLSTKVGYDIDGVPDWTYDCILAGVERALRLMRTDHLDIAHLHSCPQETLEHGGVIDALDRCVSDGKVRFAAYSGDNEPLDWALASGRFRGLMCSVNLFDQRAIDRVVAPAGKGGIGVIAKRPIGNAPWLHASQPTGQYCEQYWLRMKAMGLDLGAEWSDIMPVIALRFTAFMDGVTSCIVGGKNIDHVRANAASISAGPLDPDMVAAIRMAFTQHDDNWTGQV